MEQSTMFWYLPNDCGAAAARLVQAGTQVAWVKMADGGDIWQQAQAPGLRDLASGGLRVRPWMYNYAPTDAEIAACVRIVQRCPTDVVMLNPEETWAHVSDDDAAAFVVRLRAALAAAATPEHPAPLIGVSSVASWEGKDGGVWFPWEGFAREADILYPQCYFRTDMLDQIPFINGRTPEGKTVVPILPATADYDYYHNREAAGTWDVAQIAQLAQQLREGVRDFGGFSAWRADRGDYVYDGMAIAYREVAIAQSAAQLSAAAQRDPEGEAVQRIQDFWGALPGNLAGTDDPSVRYIYRADFSTYGEPANAVGLHGEYLTIWTVPGDETIRAVQPAVFAEALAAGLVEKVA